MGLYTYEDNRVLRAIIRGIVYFITLISLAWFVVYGFMDQTIISGQSMAPLLNAEDVCLINRLSYDLSDPKRFDVVLFENPGSDKANVKRIIGLPGESVQIKDGGVYIDGELLISGETRTISLAGIAENEVELNSDEYFVMGDNADSSEDSRFANIGNVRRENIKGKLWLKIMPFSELKLL